MVYYSQPLSIVAFGSPGSPVPVPQIASASFQGVSGKPVIRKSFPESWIFDEIQEYVNDISII